MAPRLQPGISCTQNAISAKYRDILLIAVSRQTHGIASAAPGGRVHRLERGAASKSLENSQLLGRSANSHMLEPRCRLMVLNYVVALIQGRIYTAVMTKSRR